MLTQILLNFFVLASMGHELSGKWTNTLGSEVYYFNFNDSGIIHGTYSTSVGAATQPEALYGTYSGGGEDNTILAFNVAWNHNSKGNPPSITTWAGFVDKETKVMKCTWLLVSNVATEDAWQNTLINQDVFTKV